MYKILIMEDDRVIADKLKEHLEKWDYEVACVQDFKRVQEEYTAFDPQLVIMDIILPFYNGFHWCTQIRQISSVPILFLSSASDNMNIVMAMNMGGDDFVEKPFDLNVLTAKIQALLRRAYSFTGQLNVLEYRDVILNLNAAAETTLNLPKIPGGKKLIYTHLTMPLTALEDLRKRGEELGDARYTALADIVDAHNGLWCPEAEEYLLANFNPED